VTSTTTGSVNVVLDGVTINPARPPHTYLGVARAISPAIICLSGAQPKLALPICLLAAHQAECLLKAYLSRDGSDDRVRAREIRHNLGELWAMASVDGLNISARPPQWLERLSELHAAPYHLRYSVGIHGIITPAPDDISSGLGHLLQVVEESLRGTSSFT
jgi:hypothetical protein